MSSEQEQWGPVIGEELVAIPKKLVTLKLRIFILATQNDPKLQHVNESVREFLKRIENGNYDLQR